MKVEVVHSTKNPCQEARLMRAFLDWQVATPVVTHDESLLKYTNGNPVPALRIDGKIVVTGFLSTAIYWSKEGRMLA